MLVFIGYRLILVTLFLSGVLATVLGAGVIAYQFFITNDTAEYVIWIVLVAAVLVGCVFGYGLVKLRKAGIFVLSCLGGVCLGLILFNAVFRYAESKIIFWVVIVGCSIACGIVSLFMHVIVAIGSTALMGSYGFVRGVSVFVGHFPDEITLIEQIKNGTAPKTDIHFWIYCGAIVVLFIVGYSIQWRTRPERKKKNYLPLK